MLPHDFIITVNEHLLEHECNAIEYDSYTMYVSCSIMEHILDCEDLGVESDIMSVGLTQYPHTTGPLVSLVGDSFQDLNNSI